MERKDFESLMMTVLSNNTFFVSSLTLFDVFTGAVDSGSESIKEHSQAFFIKIWDDCLKDDMWLNLTMVQNVKVITGKFASFVLEKAKKMWLTGNDFSS